MEVESMNIEELEKYSNLRGLNLGQAEKDYYQNIILFILYNKFSKNLVFKGGTALAKCYGLNRFSEDLDFTILEKNNFIETITKGLEDFGIKYQVKKIIESEKTEKYKIKVEGPLYKNLERTLCSITLDISKREKILLKPNIITIAHHMDVIPAFDVYVMNENEIFSEKIRAILTRESARDLYDLTFLLKKNINSEIELIGKKLDLVGIKFEKRRFLDKCKNLSNIWNSELKSLVRNIPAFEETLENAKSWVKSI